MFIRLRCFLGTHDIQGVSITSPLPGVVRVTSNFIQGSTTTGVLVAVLTTSNIYFHLLTRRGNQLRDEWTVSNVVSRNNYVSTFVVDKNGLPFNRIAIIPQYVIVVEGKIRDNNVSV